MKDETGECCNLMNGNSCSCLPNGEKEKEKEKEKEYAPLREMRVNGDMIAPSVA